MPVVSRRTVRTTIAVVCAAWFGALATYIAEPLARALRSALDLADAGDLVVWCLVLASVAALLALARRIAPVRDRLAQARARLQTTVGSRVARLPAGVTLPFVVALAFATRVALDRSAAVPRVFGDELIYSGIAKSLAAGSGLALRGVDIGLGYGPLYPLVLSPVYRFADDGAAAFLGVQTLNALLMSLTAVPAYYLARRILTPVWSLLVAVLSVAVPAMAYTSLVMTEALFYPAFTAVCLLLTLTLEHPTRFRQVLLVASILALAAVRVQALIFVPALVTAVLLTTRRDGRELKTAARRFSTAWVLLALTGAVATAAYGGDVRGPLGAYGALVRGYSVWDTIKWLAWNVAVLEVSLGFLAFGGFLVASVLLLRRSGSLSEAAFGASAAAVVVWTSISVALLSASPHGLDHIHWRSLFVVVPAILAAFAWWLQSGLPRPRTTTLSAGIVLLALPALVPWRQVVHPHSVDTPVTIVWKDLGELAPSVASTDVIVPLSALALAAFLFSRSQVVPVVSVALAFAAVAAASDYRAELPRENVERYAWVDRALPDGKQALLLHVDIPAINCPQIPAASRQRDLEVMTEFFNTSVTRVRSIWGQIVHDGLGSREITFGADGSLRDDGKLVRLSYLVADSRLRFAGTRLARLDMREVGGPWLPLPTGSLTLWQVEEPARLVDTGQIHGEELARLGCRPADTV